LTSWDPLDFSLAESSDLCERADDLVGPLRRAIEVQEHSDQNGAQVFRLVLKMTVGAQLLQKLGPVT